MSKSVGQVRMIGLVDQALAGNVPPGAAAPTGGRKWELGVIADVDPELDEADRELRNREVRWPLVLSIALIVALSAGLWLGIFALAARLATNS